MNFHRKLAAAITGALFLSLLLSSCSHNTGPHAVKINDAGDVSHLIEAPSQNATGWEATATRHAIYDSTSPVVSTPGGPILLFEPTQTQKNPDALGRNRNGNPCGLEIRRRLSALGTHSETHLPRKSTQQ